jgi:cellobiose-specific phosphotransferase system component IIC
MEDMRYLFGMPILIFGAVGLLIALVVMVGGDEDGHAAPGRSGWQAFVVLAWFTVVEYIVAIETSYNLILLTPIALAKVGLIAWFFMHVARVGGSGEH